jgi:predicted dehydrogenase
MSGRLRAGVIGLGMMGRHHVRVLRELDGVDLVAVADPGGDPHSVAGALPVLSSVAELIAAGVDYAVVATPTGRHEEVALELSASGIHTMVEKPVSVDGPSARKITDAFEAAGLVGCVGHIERFNPALQNLRARLESGELGEVYQISTRRQGPFPSRIADVGVVKDLATHDIDLTAWVAQSHYTTVSARVTHRSGRPHEDLVAAVGTLADGTVASHLVNWLTPFKERVTVVTGDRGCFVADTLTADLTFYANATVPTQWAPVSAFRGVSEGDMTRFAFAKREPLRAEHEALRDAVLGDPSRIVTMAEGLRTVEVAEALLRSAQDGASVTLPPLA